MKQASKSHEISNWSLSNLPGPFLIPKKCMRKRSRSGISSTSLDKKLPEPLPKRPRLRPLSQSPTKLAIAKRQVRPFLIAKKPIPDRESSLSSSSDSSSESSHENSMDDSPKKHSQPLLLIKTQKSPKKKPRLTQLVSKDVLAPPPVSPQIEEIPRDLPEEMDCLPPLREPPCSEKASPGPVSPLTSSSSHDSSSHSSDDCSLKGSPKKPGQLPPFRTSKRILGLARAVLKDVFNGSPAPLPLDEAAPLEEVPQDLPEDSPEAFSDSRNDIPSEDSPKKSTIPFLTPQKNTKTNPGLTGGVSEDVFVQLTASPLSNKSIELQPSSASPWTIPQDSPEEILQDFPEEMECLPRLRDSPGSEISLQGSPRKHTNPQLQIQHSPKPPRPVTPVSDEYQDSVGTFAPDEQEPEFPENFSQSGMHVSPYYFEI